MRWGCRPGRKRYIVLRGGFTERRHGMEWREVVEHPSLKDLPFKIETNEWGKIIMAPVTCTRGLQGILAVR